MDNSQTNKPIDLVIRHVVSNKVVPVEMQYVAEGGPAEAIFTGTGKSIEEAIGSYFVQNRETLGFKFTIVKGDGQSFSHSTQYGRSRDISELGPNELMAYNKLVGRQERIE